MNSLTDISHPIEAELKEFQKRFKASMKSKVPLLDRISYYIVQRKGKQVRPMFVFLSAKMIAPVNESTYIAASLIELLHTATLVHDDVVDDAHIRRGFFSLNALWKNKIAVLVGDFLFMKGFLLALENDEFDLIHIVSKAVTDMSEGELLQIEKSRKLNITEEVYFEIIRQKTASLIAAACSAGTASISDDKSVIKKMNDFGTYAGMAFQIKDDLFDYGYNNIGKPTGIDIKEKKLTLPLIHALSQSTSSERKEILRLIRKKSDKKKTQKTIVDFVTQNGGMVYAQEKMIEFQKKSLDLIADIPESPSKKAMVELVRFIVDRKH